MKKLLLFLFLIPFCAGINGQKITALPAVTSPDSTSLLLIRKGSTGNVLSKISLGSLLKNKVSTSEFISASGSLTLAGADAVTLSTLNTTFLTLPTSGILATTQNINDTISNGVDISAIAVMLADSTPIGAGHYESKYAASLLVPYTGATTALAMATHDITLTTGKIDAEGAVAGNPNIYGFNSSSTDQSVGVKGRVYYNSNVASTTYAGWFQNTADNASGVNVGGYFQASGAGMGNWAGWFISGNVKIEDKIVQTQISAALTDGIPTDSEIDTATGTTPANAGAGWQCTIKDNNGTGLIYRIESDGTNWFYTVMVKAL